MKNLISILMLLISVPAMSQARIGSKLDSIRAEFPSSEYTTETGLTQYENIYYKVIFTDGIAIYLFDKNQDCTGTMIQPSSLGGLNGLVEKYNKNYTIISNKKWRAYSATAIVDIELIYSEDSTLPYFLWTIAEE